jgi:hypothetical protein
VTFLADDISIIANALSDSTREAVRTAVNGIVDSHAMVSSEGVTVEVLAEQDAKQIQADTESNQILSCSLALTGGNVGKLGPRDLADILRVAITEPQVPVVTEVIVDSHRSSKTNNVNATVVYSLASSPATSRDVLRTCASSQAHMKTAAKLSQITGLELHAAEGKLASVDGSASKNSTSKSAGYVNAQLTMTVSSVNAEVLRKSTVARARIAEIITSKAQPFVTRPVTLDLSSVSQTGAKSSSIIIKVVSRESMISSAVQQILLPETTEALENAQLFDLGEGNVASVEFSIDLL